jgi:hypothetical protein
MDLKLAICDWGEATFDDNHHNENISPYIQKSPEVLIGVPWTMKTDIWALGCVIFNVMSDRFMFSGKATRYHHDYNEVVHMHEIYMAFGP